LKDHIIQSLLKRETQRQQNSINLIASENIASATVMATHDSVLMNKYAEGYIHNRYYEGCEIIDEIECLAINRAKQLFGAKHVNVQPHSGSQANHSVFSSMLKPNDKILSMSLSSGGHLTHGSSASVVGKIFDVKHYDVDRSSHFINYDVIEDMVKKEKPKLLIAGCSSYSRKINFKIFADIAKQYQCLLLADVAHIAGLIVTNQHQNPLPYADVVTTTTHKTLRGPRGGLIMTNNSDIAERINSAVFPGIQGGPMMHNIAAKAVAFFEASQKNFTNYIIQTVKNAQCFAETLQGNGYEIISGGTDNHLFVLNLSTLKMHGKKAVESLSNAGIICNKNCIPFDPLGPFVTSGLRIGTPAITSRGMKEKECIIIANLITKILQNDYNISEIKNKVHSLCTQFPINTE